DSKARVLDFGVVRIVADERLVHSDGLRVLLLMVRSVGEAQLGQTGVAAVSPLALHLLEELIRVFPVAIEVRVEGLLVGLFGILRIMKWALGWLFGRACGQTDTEGEAKRLGAAPKSAKHGRGPTRSGPRRKEQARMPGVSGVLGSAA